MREFGQYYSDQHTEAIGAPPGAPAADMPAGSSGYAPPTGGYGPPSGGGWQYPPPPSPPPKKRGVLIAVIAVIALLVAAAAVGLTLWLTRDGGTGGGTPSAAPPPVNPGGGPITPGKKTIPIAKSVAKPTVGDTVPVGPTPGYMEISPDGSFGYIANRAAGVITVFDTTRKTVTGTIPVPDGGPQFVAFSPDGSRAYVSIFNNDYTLNEVGVLDTATNTFITSVPVGVRPFALDVTPDGK